MFSRKFFSPGKGNSRSGGSLRPVLAILTAVLAVQMYQNGMISFNSGIAFDEAAFLQGVFRLSGVSAPAGPDEGVWRPGELLAVQSPAFGQAVRLGAEGAGRLSAQMYPSAAPDVSTPSAATPDMSTPKPGGPEVFTPRLGPSAAAPSELPEASVPPEVDPYTAWIGGVYSPPPADDPEAKRLIEVTLLPSSGSGYDNNGTVYIKNKVTDPLDVAKIMKRDMRLTPGSGDEPQILIVHTHGSESYFPDERDYYVPTDIQRTEDTQFNVVRIGDRIAEGLRAYGLNVLHDHTICDSPSYSGAYTKSLKLIQQHLKDHPSIQMVIDVHRDSLVSENGTAYKVVSNTGKGKAAQMMFVMGSNLNGLDHPYWLDNLNLACQMQQAMLEEYPTLVRPMTLRKERYNQHATPGSCLLEVGTAWNTLQEALLAADLFCETTGPLLADYLLKG